MALHTAASEPLATRNSVSDSSGHHVPAEIWQHYNSYFKSSNLSPFRCHCLHYALHPRSLKPCWIVVAESCDAFRILIHYMFLIKWVKTNFLILVLFLPYSCSYHRLYCNNSERKGTFICYNINCVGRKVKIILRNRILVVCIVFCWVWIYVRRKR
jgi:hypothetical protein